MEIDMEFLFVIILVFVVFGVPQLIEKVEQKTFKW
jgi:Na+-transporting methylmalonyl-CoA/oxaloacetate decarboxylase gamma subunit